MFIYSCIFSFFQSFWFWGQIRMVDMTSCGVHCEVVILFPLHAFLLLHERRGWSHGCCMTSDFLARQGRWSEVWVWMILPLAFILLFVFLRLFVAWLRMEVQTRWSFVSSGTWGASLSLVPAAGIRWRHRVCTRYQLTDCAYGVFQILDYQDKRTCSKPTSCCSQDWRHQHP